MRNRALRMVIATSVLTSLAVLSPASAARLNCPSTFDYLVLASFADSPNLLALSAYRRSLSAHTSERAVERSAAQSQASMERAGERLTSIKISAYISR